MDREQEWHLWEKVASQPKREGDTSWESPWPVAADAAHVNRSRWVVQSEAFLSFLCCPSVSPVGDLGFPRSSEKPEVSGRQLIKRAVMPGCLLPHSCFLFYLSLKTKMGVFYFSLPAWLQPRALLHRDTGFSVIFPQNSPLILHPSSAFPPCSLGSERSWAW